MLQTQGDGLVCHWNECLRGFSNHEALSHHLSEEHIGWKKGEYCCEWTNCSRKGVKCHNRFALIMHLRIHTQEKPFECDVDGCGMNFGRLDALTRHKKAEHGIDTQGNSGKVGTAATLDHKTSTSIKIEDHDTQPRKQNLSKLGDLSKPATSRCSTKKRKLAREEDHTEKYKRGRLDNGGRQQYDSDVGDYGGIDLHMENSATETIYNQQKQIYGSSSASSSSSLSPQNKYKIAKAKLQYILRENEMLNDEWTTLQQRLRRLQTERRVLLDALMSTEDDKDDDLWSSDGDDNDDLHYGINHNDRHGSNLIKEQAPTMGTQASHLQAD